jgi:hypothetical protein
MDAFGQRGSAQKIDRVIGAIALMHFEADDLAAVHVQDQVKIKSLTHDTTGKEREIPAPQLARRCGNVCARRPLALRCFHRPRWRACPCAPSTRLKLDSLAM